ncbi:MAG: thioredoxin [Clostridia bacterium]|nr:thioredoxin [Clostridia bacterium]
MATELTVKSFDEKVMKSNVPVLIDFFADWCGPCVMLSPTIAELANEANGKYEVYKVNVDKEPELANKFGVFSIPTLVVMENGKLKNKSVGLKSKAAILAMLA